MFLGGYSNKNHKMFVFFVKREWYKEKLVCQIVVKTVIFGTSIAIIAPLPNNVHFWTSRDAND